jgi:hypothetical protein
MAATAAPESENRPAPAWDDCRAVFNSVGNSAALLRASITQILINIKKAELHICAPDLRSENWLSGDFFRPGYKNAASWSIITAESVVLIYRCLQTNKHS